MNIIVEQFRLVCSKFSQRIDVFNQLNNFRCRWLQIRCWSKKIKYLFCNHGDRRTGVPP